MKTILTAFLFLFSYSAFSQNCDCKSADITQACKNDCSIKLLQTGTKEDLKNVLKLDDQTIQKVLSVHNRKSKKSVEDFQDDLSYKAYVHLVDVLNTWQNEKIAVKTEPFQKIRATQSSLYKIQR